MRKVRFTWRGFVSGLAASATLVAMSVTAAAALPALGEDLAENADSHQSAQSGASTEQSQGGAAPETAQSGNAAASSPRAGTSPAHATLNLLHINDFHGTIDGLLNDSGDALIQSAAVNFAWQLQQLRTAASAEETIFLAGGDNVGASLFPSALQRDQPAISVLNELGLQATAAGNHEFDSGWADLNDRIKEAFDAPVLGANVFWKGTTDRALPAYTILETAGLRVAVVGAVTADTTALVNTDLIEDLAFTDPVSAVNEAVAELVALPPSNRPDIIVAEYHEGAPTGAGSSLEEQLVRSSVFRSLVNDTSPLVDVIFTGHTHQEYAWEAPIPGTDRRRPVVQAGHHATNIGQVQLRIDPDTGEVNSWSAQLVPVPQPGDPSLPTFSQMRQDPTVDAVYELVLAAVQEAELEGGKETARLTGPITSAFTSGFYDGGVFSVSGASERDDRSEASALGTALSDMFVHALKSLPGAPDIGVNNPGGMRADLFPSTGGTVTVAEARAVLPFNNELSIASLTGEQIVTLLEQQWQRTATGEVPSRDFLELGLSSNVRYTFTEVADPQISGATKGVIHTVTIDGEPVDPDRTYRVATVAFLASGADNFHVFPQAEVVNTGLSDWEAWLNYLAETSPVSPNFARSGVHVTGLIPGSAVRGGDTVTITLSGMNVPSVGAPDNTLVDAWLGGVQVAASERFNSNRVTLKFAVPKNLVGEVPFRALFPDSGTEVTFPITAVPAPVTPGKNGGDTPGAQESLASVEADLARTGASVLWFAVLAAVITGSGVMVLRGGQSR